MKKYKFKLGQILTYKVFDSTYCSKCGEYTGTKEKNVKGKILKRSYESLMTMMDFEPTNEIKENPDGTIINRPYRQDIKLENYPPKPEPCYTLKRNNSKKKDYISEEELLRQIKK